MPNQKETATTKSGTPLEQVQFFQPSKVKKLKACWIDTIEDFVTTAHEDLGCQGLAEILKIKPARVKEIAQELLPRVALDIRNQIGLPPPRYAMGALDKQENGASRSLGFGPAVNLPPRVSLVSGMPPIRNQGGRGTCVAHACTALREHIFKDPTLDLSEQFLYWATRQKMPSLYPKDQPGAMLIFGMEALTDFGICNEADWPYNPVPIPGDEVQGKPPPEVLAKANSMRIRHYEFIWPRDINSLKERLSQGQMVVFTVPTFNFWSAVMIRRTGAIRMPLLSEGILNPITWLESAHALSLVGYQDDATVPGGGYLIIRNSWGKDWGEQCSDGAGYGWIPYAYLVRFGLTAFWAQ